MNLKIWRNGRIIEKKVILGRLESSQDYLAENKKESLDTKEEFIEDLKISVRDLNDNDKSEREIDKGITGTVITNIQTDSPLVNFLQPGDIIVEVQKEKVLNVFTLSKQIRKHINKGETTLLLTIYNSLNQRRYLGVKID